MLSRRAVLAGLPLATAATAAATEAPTPAETLIAAARSQIGVTRFYDPSYVGLDYPMGDVPPDRGVCSDVVVRAYRDAFGFDLQRAVHEDMAANFAAYPTIWELSRPDRNIDHRRVPNLETFLTRQGARRPLPERLSGWEPGDVASMRVDNLPHIAIVSDRITWAGRWRILHNIGRGTREDDALWRFDLVARFRFSRALNCRSNAAAGSARPSPCRAR